MEFFMEFPWPLWILFPACTAQSGSCSCFTSAPPDAKLQLNFPSVGFPGASPAALLGFPGSLERKCSVWAGFPLGRGMCVRSHGSGAGTVGAAHSRWNHEVSQQDLLSQPSLVPDFFQRRSSTRDGIPEVPWPWERICREREVAHQGLLLRRAGREGEDERELWFQPQGAEVVPKEMPALGISRSHVAVCFPTGSSGCEGVVTAVRFSSERPSPAPTSI